MLYFLLVTALDWIETQLVKGICAAGFSHFTNGYKVIINNVLNTR